MKVKIIEVGQTNFYPVDNGEPKITSFVGFEYDSPVGRQSFRVSVWPERAQQLAKRLYQEVELFSKEDT